MIDNFEYNCRRRSGGRRISPTTEGGAIAGEENFGAGSGGEWYDGGHDHHYDGVYQVSSPTIRVMAGGLYGGSPTGGNQNGILLQASGEENDSYSESFVLVHADRRVRITTGGPDISVIDTKPAGGIRLQAEQYQIMGIVHGLTDGPHSQLVLSNEDDGTSIVMSSNVGGILIASSKKITLQVAGGTSSITLEPDQITIKGPMVYIN
jgi:hypothetical protein